MAHEIPADLRYATSDEWVRIEDGVAVVGVTDFAQDQLSDVVFVDLPAPGMAVAQGEIFGEIESVKAAAELKAPVSGVVIEVNEALEDTPELVNEDPYGAAWMIKIEVTGDLEAELAKLLDDAAYAEDIAARD